MCAEGTHCFPVCPQFGARVCYCDPWETQGAGWAGLGQRAALGGPEGGRCPSMARGRRGGRCLPWAGNGKSFSSFAFRPRKARGGSWLRARGALLGLETIPCLGHPQAGARRSPVIIHPFPTALFGVFMQALSPPSPTAAPGTPCPTRPGLCYPGGRGAAGECRTERKEGCQEEELCHAGGEQGSPCQLPASPTPHTLLRSPGLEASPTYARSAFGASLLLHRHPNPSLYLALGCPPALWGPQRVLQTQPVAPRALCGASAGHPPLPPPRAQPRLGLWLR